MRIVDRKTFLAMPVGTIFAKFGDQYGSKNNMCFGEILIKGDTTGKDFIAQEFNPWFKGCKDSGHYFDNIDKMVDGESSEAVLDYYCNSRDGMFDERQRFAIWDFDDATELLERIKEAIKDGYT